MDKQQSKHAAPREMQPELWDMINAMRAAGAMVGIHRNGTDGRVSALSFANVPNVAGGAWGIHAAADIMRTYLAAR